MIKIPKLNKIDIEQNIFLFLISAVIAVLSLSFLIGVQWSKVRINQVEQKLSALSKKNQAMEFDRQRLEDVQNILLALQDYQFDYKTFPETLAILKEKGYLGYSNNLKDPATGTPYFYQNRGTDFVFCVNLSDSIKGVNTDGCPLFQ